MKTRYKLSDFATADAGKGQVCYLWPTDPGEVVYPDFLFQPLLDIAKSHPLLVPPRDVPYSGFATPSSSGLGPWDRLSGEYSRGAPLVEELLAIAFALGFEQGQRHAIDNLRPSLKSLVKLGLKAGSVARIDAESVAERTGLEINAAHSPTAETGSKP